MQRRELGRTGTRVSAIGLGGMPLSILGRPSPPQARDVIAAALAAGVDFIDTADVYCLDHRDIGHNERLIAAALADAGRKDVLVATKGGLERPGGAWTLNGHPRHLKAACEASLKALGVEAIALYQLHAPDADVPFIESIGALSRLQEAGKIVHVGLSNVTVEQIDEARREVEIVSVQNRCNVFERQSIAGGVVAHCEREGITFLPYSPVGGHRGHVRVADDAGLGEVAARHKVSPYEVAIAWLMTLGERVIPIPGASKPASIRSSAAAERLMLSDDDLNLLPSRAPG
ncbi:MAG: aldo/keto reductase [Myxococcales bacterium]|nr:aldo/keto reductase [Myxococcales bacterium]